MKRKGNKNYFKPEKRRTKKEIKKRKRQNDSLRNGEKKREIEPIEEKRILGTYSQSKNFGFVMPDSRKIRTDIYISKNNNLNAKNNQKVIVEIIKQPERGKKPEGRIIEIVGNADQAGIDMLGLIKEYDLPYEFPREVTNELEYIENQIDINDVKSRVDLRGEEIFTIDGEDAKDLDDAISVEKKEDGTYKLNVHIADVSHYVKEGSSLNKEAIIRGTSIYMLDRVIPMLPPKLSNGICSLNEGEDRFTLSISMEINKNGIVTSSKIYKAVINVTKRMSYTDVYKIYQEDEETIEKYKPYVQHFKLMEELAKVLEERRIRDGYLDLEIPESKIILDEEGKAIDVKKYETNFAHKTIEQFMLTANEEIAKTFEKLKAPFIYRVHETPDTEKVEDLNKFLYNLGYKIEKSEEEYKPKAFQSIINNVKEKPEEKVISTLVLRTLRLAKYEKDNKGHFGIASKYYCHFTSPIRRYPDLFIHRVISKYLEANYKPDEKMLGKLRAQSEKYAETSSETERIATTVERDAEDIKKAEYMEDKIGEIYDGIISSLTSFGIFVELENTVEGFLSFENLGNDYYIYDEEKRQLTGEHTKEIYKIGDKIKIQVIEANKLQRRISFKIVPQ